MAPEIHMRKPYIGTSVDLFATGIILFIMFTQHPPFTKAVPEDPFYRLICANRADLFWKAHPWYNGPVATLEDVHAEFTQRIEVIRKENE